MTGVQLQETSAIVLLYYLVFQAVYEDNANVFITGFTERRSLCRVCECVGGVNQRSLDRVNNAL